MNILNEAEINTIVSNSKLVPKYNREINNESAYEILNEKLVVAEQKTQEAKATNQQTKAAKQTVKETSFLDTPAMRQVERTAASVITRSLLGALGLGGSTRRRRSTSLW
jgi:hypothetical protein